MVPNRFAYLRRRGVARLLVPPLAAGALIVAGPATGRAEADANLVSGALEILESFHGASGADAGRRTVLVYFTPADREPAPGWDTRVPAIMEDIAGFYADEMERHGFGRRTVRYQRDADGRPVVHLVRGEAEFADYGMGDGARIRREALPVLREAGVDPDGATLMIFCHLTEWDGTRISHQSPYYGGGNARGGNCWASDSEIQAIENLADGDTEVIDGQYGRISLGRHNTIFIGGVAHELGHALGLPHNRQRPDEAIRGTALMGSGNQTYGEDRRGEGKGSFLTLAHALRLASHPQFSGSVEGLDVDPRATLADPEVAADDGGTAFRFSARLDGAEPPVYAVVGYLDPEGGGDYDATTVAAVPDRDGRFTLPCAALRSGHAAELRIVACHVNGLTSTFRFPYQVDGDGQVDLSAMQGDFLMRPLVDAIDRDDAEAAAAALATLRTALPHGAGAGDVAATAAALVDRMGAAWPRWESVDTVPAEADRVALGDLRPESASVGWRRPAFNRVPERPGVVRSGGRFAATGLYAHAPARHVYRLEGKWTEVSGHAGLQDGHPGSVVFVVIGDGEELWRSDLVRTGRPVAFRAPVAGVTSLELVVEDGGDGTGADWGVWLDPVLTR